MKELLELFTIKINHLLKIHLGKEASVKYVRNISRKSNIPNPLIRTRTCAYQGVRNVSFSENLAYVLNGWPQRSQRAFSFYSVNTVAYGLKSLKYFVKKVWIIVPFELEMLWVLKNSRLKLKVGDLKIVHVGCVWSTYIKWVTFNNLI